MVPAFLLVLAGLAAMDQPAAERPSGGPAADAGMAAAAARAEERFTLAPAQRGEPARPGSFQLAQPFELVPTRSAPQSGFMQLRNKRAGVTCTMLIVPVSPSLDAGILKPTPQLHDPIVQNDSSACAR